MCRWCTRSCSPPTDWCPASPQAQPNVFLHDAIWYGNSFVQLSSVLSHILVPSNQPFAGRVSHEPVKLKCPWHLYTATSKIVCYQQCFLSKSQNIASYQTLWKKKSTLSQLKPGQQNSNIKTVEVSELTDLFLFCLHFLFKGRTNFNYFLSNNLKGGLLPTSIILWFCTLIFLIRTFQNRIGITKTRS